MQADQSEIRKTGFEKAMRMGKNSSNLDAEIFPEQKREFGASANGQ